MGPLEVVHTMQDLLDRFAAAPSEDKDMLIDKIELFYEEHKDLKIRNEQLCPMTSKAVKYLDSAENDHQKQVITKITLWCQYHFFGS